MKRKPPPRATEYQYATDDAYHRERAALRRAQPAWDALDADEQNHRLRMAGKELGYDLHNGKWQDCSGMRIPASWVEKRALLVFAEQLQPEDA
jgi:hypothetical protein